MTDKSKQEKTLLMTRLMTPDMSNFSGKVHGGTILKLLDEDMYMPSESGPLCDIESFIDEMILFRSKSLSVITPFIPHILVS